MVDRTAEEVLEDVRKGWNFAIRVAKRRGQPYNRFECFAFAFCGWLQSSKTLERDEAQLLYELNEEAR